jgi:hypothetical protein
MDYSAALVVVPAGALAGAVAVAIVEVLGLLRDCLLLEWQPAKTSAIAAHTTSTVIVLNMRVPFMAETACNRVDGIAGT